MSFFNNFRKKYLPERYIPVLISQKENIQLVIQNENYGISAVQKHKRAINYIINGNPSKSMELLYEAYIIYEKIDISEYSSKLLKCRGDCLLDAIIISNIFEKKYNVDSFDPDSICAFVYLWISFELSHYTLLYSLKSISELFFFFAEGMMITVAGFIQTMPPTHFSEYFSIVCEYWIAVYAGIEFRSIGNPSEKRWLFGENKEVFPIDKERKKYLDKMIRSADNRIIELTTHTNNYYGHNLDLKQMKQAIQEPISEEDNISYVDLFDTMIRNLKKNSAGPKVTDLFKRIPITFNEAFKMENAHALFSLIYADMYNKENKKSDVDVSEELFKLGIKYNQLGKYGTANVIFKEALCFNRNNYQIQDFIEQNTAQLLKKETGINMNKDIDDYYDDEFLW